MKNKEIVVPRVLIPIDRSTHYPLPNWATGWQFPHFGSIGPIMIDLGRLTGFPERPDLPSNMVCSDLVEILRGDDLIDKCLNFQAGRQIAAYEYCHSIFGGKKVYLWQSVVRDNRGSLYVPHIQNIRGQTPIIYWLWLGYRIDLSQCLSILMQ